MPNKNQTRHTNGKERRVRIPFFDSKKSISTPNQKLATMVPKSIIPTNVGLGTTSKYPNETSCTNLSRIRGWCAIAHHHE
jgi:hypothetical protein